MTEQRHGPVVWALLALRFLVELALFFAPVVIARRAVDGAGGLLLGIAVTVALAALWGLLLSPRRRVDLPLAARVVIEGLLFVAVAAGLAATGLGGPALALVAVEVVVVVWLWLLGMPPGSDAGAPS